MPKEGLPVQTSCRILEVSESGFYEWRNRPPSERSLRHAWLTQLITEVHTTSHGTYGARRIHAELTLGHDIAVGHGCIEMLMRAAGVKGLPGNKRARSKHQTPTASDLVDRKFTRDEPNKLWVTDITEHPTPCIPAVVATLVIKGLPVKHSAALQGCPSRAISGVGR